MAKKFLSLFLALVMSISFLTVLSVSTAAYSMGDLNADGKINAADSLLIRRTVVGKEQSLLVKTVSDLNSDGKINVTDSGLMRKMITGAYSAGEAPKVGTVTLGGVPIYDYSVRIPTEFPLGAYKESADYAAEILTKNIKNACGILLPVTENPAEHEIRFVIDEENYGTEAFNINVGDGNVIIRCGTQRGMQYGAFGFLEEIFGFRFYGNNTKYLYKNNEINIKSGYSHTEGLNTPFKYRHTYTRLYLNGKYLGAYDGAFPDSYTAAHITGSWDGLQSKMWTPKYGYGYGPDRNHSMFALMPEACKNDSHVAGGWYNWTDAMVCYTNSDNFDECMSNLVPYLEGLEAKGFIDGVNMPMISLSNNDSFYWCSCRFCNKLVDKYGSSAATLIDFIERVHDALQDRYPRIQFWTLGYYCTATAPNMEIPDYIYVCYCYYPGCNNHPLNGTECDPTSSGAHNDWNENNIRGWMSVANNIHVWYYTSEFSFSVTGDPIIKRVYEDIKYIKSLGVKGIFGQASDDSLGWDGLIEYLMSEMMWNPDMSWEEYEALGHEYCNFNYGAAGEKLWEYFMFMEEASDRSGCWCCLGDSPNYVYNYAFIAENRDYLVNLLESAIGLAANDTERDKIEKISMQMYFILLNASYDEMYTNGTEETRAEYAVLYTRMYERFVKFKNTVQFSDMPGTTTGAVPETCNTTIRPIDWYTTKFTRVSARWW